MTGNEATLEGQVLITGETFVIELKQVDGSWKVDRIRGSWTSLGSPVKVVVTGAAGFIGSHLVEECQRRGWSVVAIDSLTTYYSPTAKVRNADHFRRHHALHLIEQDILDVDLPALLAGPRSSSTWRRRRACGGAGVRASTSTRS